MVDLRLAIGSTSGCGNSHTRYLRRARKGNSPPMSSSGASQIRARFFAWSAISRSCRPRWIWKPKKVRVPTVGTPLLSFDTVPWGNTLALPNRKGIGTHCSQIFPLLGSGCDHFAPHMDQLPLPPASFGRWEWPLLPAKHAGILIDIVLEIFMAEIVMYNAHSEYLFHLHKA